jgi:hypothetical protein
MLERKPRRPCWWRTGPWWSGELAGETETTRSESTRPVTTCPPSPGGTGRSPGPSTRSVPSRISPRSPGVWNTPRYHPASRADLEFGRFSPSPDQRSARLGSPETSAPPIRTPWVCLSTTLYGGCPEARATNLSPPGLRPPLRGASVAFLESLCRDASRHIVSVCARVASDSMSPSPSVSMDLLVTI